MIEKKNDYKKSPSKQEKDNTQRALQKNEEERGEESRNEPYTERIKRKEGKRTERIRRAGGSR